MDYGERVRRGFGATKANFVGPIYGYLATTEWSNLILHRKLKYFISLVGHLSNGIYDTSIYGVNSSWTSLYKDDRVTEKRFFIKNVYYHFESETLEIKFGALRYKEATKHARILNQCSLLFFFFHIGMWTRFSTGTGELGTTPAALHLTLDSNCPNTVHCASRVCAQSHSMRENLCDEKQLMRSQNEAETKLLSQWSSFRPK